MNDKYMKYAIQESKKCLKTDDVPVGAIIIKGDTVISKAYNKDNYNQNIHEHAEIVAINKAIKKTGNNYLDDCVLYVTMEPCLMCYGAISRTNIKKIVYGVSNEKFGFTKFLNRLPKQEILSGICETEIKKILNYFFKNKRN